MILHIVNQSPFSHPALELCLRSLSDSDSLILIEDSTLLLSNSQICNNLPGPDRLFILADDCEARGMAPDPAIATPVDYARFVELVTLHQKTLSWF